jgi:hypothetical protein
MVIGDTCGGGCFGPLTSPSSLLRFVQGVAGGLRVLYEEKGEIF